ncbi:hypothetical protein WG8_2577 [Paenibacillus sp. Aloe-11]|nr:hypothetical protein WG8_2577 [Paenibacillus sp. Aloe-11]
MVRTKVERRPSIAKPGFFRKYLKRKLLEIMAAVATCHLKTRARR